ncbi:MULTISPECIES: GH3 auxin-responsive promoter family protein [unclassified Mesorhizobium]|uniref:GH3 family domain-containing protein n=1 Tax=unclassified Mesorhizobium TaxID=325217 RepID=UPI00112D51F9|nr:MULTISPECIES: GH3 auxin-responsive promoter family protein [unclassified Mesorhizobium]TPL03122.1 GH3 auxin-responsive promoter family protein [Mesorhizobium sp. B2-4-16]TPL73888.1 GH3 auxin-responsive promoter family protein [Mesorhizobium sp. B2-4-3]
MVADAWARIAGATAAARMRFDAGLGDVETAQRRTLADLIKANRLTAFGRDNRFVEVTSAESFSRLVPIGDYAAFQPYIDRLIEGVGAVLTAEPVRFFEQTGGSSGGAKNIPYTDAGLKSFTDCLYPWLADLIARRPAVTQGRSYFALSPVGRSLNQRIGPYPLGSPLPFAYFGALRSSLIELSAVPMELRLLADFDAWQRQTCLCLLQAEDLALIWVWSPTYLTEILRAMRRDASNLLPTLANRLAITQERKSVNRRIETLENMLCGSSDDLSAIWPRLDTISCWTDASSKGFAAELQALFPRAFMQSKGLMSTEAAVSVPYGDGAGSVLAAHSGFFEFIDESGDCRFAWQLEIGRTYRVVVSTGSGLYRYDTCDMVEVVGFSGDTPRLRFSGRAGVTVDMCGEKLSETFVASCLELIHVPTYALLAATTSPRPHYQLLVETSSEKPLDSTLPERLDRALAANPQYEYARRIGQLDLVRLKPVDDLYGRWKRHRLQGGVSIAGMKAPVLLGQVDSLFLAGLGNAGS